MIQKFVCQGPRADALKSGISMGQKKDPTEILYFCFFDKNPRKEGEMAEMSAAFSHFDREPNRFGPGGRLFPR